MADEEPMRLRALRAAERELVGRVRLAQGPIMALTRTIPDANGRIGSPFVALATLARMERSGTITALQRRAGEEFHRVFRRAALDELRASDLARVSGGSGKRVAANGNERARKQIASAMSVLGGERSLAASCAWHVLGLEWSLREWAAKATQTNVHRATGVLVATLDLLDPHFGD